MNLRPIIVSAAVLALVACDDGAKGTPAPTAKPSATPKTTAMATATTATTAPKPDEEAGVFFQIPADGAKVFQTFHVLVSMPEGLDLEAAAKGDEAASIVVLTLAEPLKAGETPPEGAKAFPVSMEGDHTAAVELEKAGEQKLTVQILDGEGKAWKPELAETITVTAVAVPDPLAVEWLEPKDGAKVKSPVKMKFGVKGMEVVPAGKDPKSRVTGHHHVLIGKESHPFGKVIPADEKHKHFGKGQTEAELELPKGEHTLALQFADGTHASYGERMAATITITVE